MIIRLFLSAVAPNDVDEMIQRFQEDVLPAFNAHPDCLGIELIRAAEPGAGGLIEGGVLTRWADVESMETALRSDPIVASQARVRELLRREPLRKIYEVVA